MDPAQLGLLGLGIRAGHVIVGTNGVREALQKGELQLVVIASDRSSRTEEKIGRLARARGVALLEGPPADELGRRLGRESVQAVGVRDSNLAKGIRGERAAQDH